MSRRRLEERVNLPEASAPWALDSGGFSELTIHGKWMLSPEDYVDQVRDYADKIGKMEFAAIQDWMCEPQMLNGDAKTKGTGLTVRDHQELTVQNMIRLTELAPDLPWCPVLQGWEIDEYHQHVQMYLDAGFDLRDRPIVGIGSVCRRQHTTEIETLIKDLYHGGISLHGFGFKIRGLANVAHYLKSADSMAWSYQARRRPPLEECVAEFKRLDKKGHKNCANCQRYALQWRGNVMQTLRNAQDTPREGETSDIVEQETVVVSSTKMIPVVLSAVDEDFDLENMDLRKEITDLVDSMTRHYYRLGRLLRMANGSDAWLEWGYSSWEEYLEIEIGYKKRTAQDYMRIAGTFDETLQIPYTEVGHIGWSKLKTIESICTDAAEARKWIKKAERNPRSMLEGLVRAEKAKRAGRDPEAAAAPKTTRVQHDTTEILSDVASSTDTPAAAPDKLVTIDVPAEIVNDKGETETALHKFGPIYLNQAQWKNVMAAFGILGQVANTGSDATMLDLMATEINNSLAGEDGGILQLLDWYKENLERIFEIQIAITVPEGSKLRKMARLEEEPEYADDPEDDETEEPEEPETENSDEEPETEEEEDYADFEDDGEDED